MGRRIIAFVESAKSMGGVEFSTLYIAERMNSNRWQPIVICPGEGDMAAECRKKGIPVEFIELGSLKSTSFEISKHRIPNLSSMAYNCIRLYAAVQDLTQVLRKRPIDLIVTKGLMAHLYGGFAARRFGLPCVWHLQDFISERYFGALKWTFGFLAGKIPDEIIVDGRSIKEQLPGGLRSKARIILNGIDTSLYSPKPRERQIRKEFGIPVDALVIGNVARITRWKGQAYLIKAFDEIKNIVPNAFLILVGSSLFDAGGYEADLRRKVKLAGLEDRVIFTGYRFDLEKVLRAMDIFAYSSIEKDTSPLAVLSAMASGLPVVAFAIDGIKEIIEHSKEGILVRPSDSRELAQAILRLSQDRFLRSKMGNAARHKAERAFSLSEFAAKCEAVFTSAIENRVSL